VRHPEIEAIRLQPLNKAEEVGIDADGPILDLPPHAVVVVENRLHAVRLSFLVTPVDRPHRLPPPEARFASLEEMTAQIDDDASMARRILSAG
jgi:hypothetical protein